MQVWAYLDGAWRRAVTLYTKGTGDPWRKVTQAWYYTGSEWKQVFQAVLGYSGTPTADATPTLDNPNDIVFAWAINGGTYGVTVQIRKVVGDVLVTTANAADGGATINDDPYVEYELLLVDGDGTTVDSFAGFPAVDA